ncbi:MAG: hypothetical protein ABJC79_08530 [Acidimicrobiia bacterium]
MCAAASEPDARRARVAADGSLTGACIAELTPVVRALPLDVLTPVKQLLKRFFSDEPWTATDDAALADAVGPGTGSERREIAPGLVLAWAWESDRFRLRLLDE